MEQINEFFAEKAISSYQIKSVYIQTSNATLYIAENKEHNIVGCLKFISKNKIKELRAEINTYLALANHPNAPIMFDYYISETGGFIFMELINGRDLYNGFSKIGCPWKCLRQICELIKHLHSKNIAHFDLKLENVVINKNGVVKVIDFGLALPVVDEIRTERGTRDFISPEMIEGKGITKAVDLWGIGCIAYEMFTRNMPFQEKTHDENYAKILAVSYNTDLLAEESQRKFVCGLLTKKETRMDIDTTIKMINEFCPDI